MSYLKQQLQYIEKCQRENYKNPNNYGDPNSYKTNNQYSTDSNQKQGYLL